MNAPAKHCTNVTEFDQKRLLATGGTKSPGKAIANRFQRGRATVMKEKNFVQKAIEGWSVKTIGKYKFQLQSPLETSLPGVFAVGDVRAENVKRAATLGEGSIAVASVHQVLHE